MPTVPTAATEATEALLRRSLETRIDIFVQTYALKLSTAQLRTTTEGAR